MAKTKTELEIRSSFHSPALRDVIEDSDITAEELLSEGIPAEVGEDPLRPTTQGHLPLATLAPQGRSPTLAVS